MWSNRVIAPAAVRLHYLAVAISSENMLLKGVTAFICLQVEMHYGLLASTFPALKPFVQQFDTGWGTYDTQGITEYSLQSLGSKGKSRRDRVGSANTKLRSQREEEHLGTREGRSVATAFASQHRPTSQNSHESQQMFIRRTVETEVEHGEPSLSSQGER